MMTTLIEHLLATPVWVSLLVVFALPALEASVFLGFVFPGEIAVLLGGVLASQGHTPLAGVLLAGIGGAICGDSVGYVVGRRWGRRILDSTLGRFVKAEDLDRAERAVAKHGLGAVFIGRFAVALRVMIPGLAGMAGMGYRRFAAANIAGGIVWGTAIVLAGYLAGNSWHSVQHYVSLTGLVVTTATVVLMILGWRIGRRRARRAAHSAPRHLAAVDSSPERDLGRRQG